ncbi:MAG: hypothetical protein A2W09_04060 [Deltaproteobacteria bacterium RBG_16_50_11]|nr:MAG: hypothetical protein A2W09_04060 [Deltaproteobacteria bacterium RBG_16_50_11]
MPSRIKHGLLITVILISLFFTSVLTSHAETINYIYDELNRLIRVEYGNGTVIEYIYDKAGNRVTEIVDTAPPTTTASPPGGPYSTAQSVTLTCDDSTGLGCDQIYFTTDGTTPTTSSTVYSTPIIIFEPTTLRFFAIDFAGHSETPKTETYTFETTPPTGTLTINSEAAHTNNPNVTLTLTCSDASGCSQMQFSNDGTTYSAPEAYATTKVWPLSSGDGTKTVYAKFMDTAGNWSIAYSDTILLDTTPPTTTATPPGGFYGSAQSVTLACSDGSGSGCDKIYYTTDGTTPTTASPVYSSPINISVTTILKFFATDLSGNSEAVKTENYNMDPIVINSGAAFTNSASVTLTLNCPMGGGCTKMKFSNNNITYSLEQTFNQTRAWTLSAGNGMKTVYAKFKDTAGVWSSAYSDTIRLIQSIQRPLPLRQEDPMAELNPSR